MSNVEGRQSEVERGQINDCVVTTLYVNSCTIDDVVGFLLSIDYRRVGVVLLIINFEEADSLYAGKKHSKHETLL